MRLSPPEPDVAPPTAPDPAVVMWMPVQRCPAQAAIRTQQERSNQQRQKSTECDGHMSSYWIPHRMRKHPLEVELLDRNLSTCRFRSIASIKLWRNHRSK